MDPAELLAACPRGIPAIEQIHQTGGEQRVLDGVKALRRLGMMFASLVLEAGSMTNVGGGHGRCPLYAVVTAGAQAVMILASVTI